MLLCIVLFVSACPAPRHPDTIAIIPLTFDSQNLPIVEIDINGYHGRFYIDTGARGIHLPTQVIDDMDGVKFTGKTVKSIDLAGNLREDKAFVIEDLRINGVAFHDISGQVLSEWGVGRTEHALPVIGLDVFRKKDLVIDFPQHKLLVSSGPIPFESLYQDPQDLPCRDIDEGVAIYVNVGENTWPFILDTGANVCLIKTSAPVDRALIVPCDIELPTGECEMALANIPYGAGTIDLHLIRIHFPDEFKPMGIIGYDLFSQCALYFNFDAGIAKISLATLPE